MAGWRKARPWRGGGQLEHSTEMGSAFKLHTVAQWTGESTDKMDPNQPRLPSRDQPSIGVQVWTETYLMNSFQLQPVQAEPRLPLSLLHAQHRFSVGQTVERTQICVLKQQVVMIDRFSVSSSLGRVGGPR